MVPVIAAVFAIPWWLLRRRHELRKHNPDEGIDLVTHPEVADKIRSRPAITTPFWLLYACCFVAVLSHPLLDWCTSYGTQLFWPITFRRFAIDAIGIIDIIYTPILALTLLLCWLVRKRRAEGAKRATIKIAAVGLILSTAYLAAGWVLQKQAVAKARKHVPTDTAVVRADAYPMIGTILLWRVVLRTEDGWIVTRIHQLAGDDKPPKSASAAEAEDNEWIRRARQTQQFRTYRGFAMGRVRTEYEEKDGRHVVRFHDMRYAWGSDDPKGIWPLEVVFDATGGILKAERSPNSPRSFAEAAKAIADIWADMWNP